MPKRKRDDAIDTLFFRHRTDLFHALKTAKGFERQRQSKRLSDPKTIPDKKARIENEIVVLKSLDLQQTAHAHLCSSLLKIKAVAESPKLPEEIKAGVAKPELTEEERAALHNVTSSLYNRVEVRRVVEKAVGEVCRALGVEVGKKGKGKEGEKEKKKGGDEVKVETKVKESGRKGTKEEAKKAEVKTDDAGKPVKVSEAGSKREMGAKEGSPEASDGEEEIDDDKEEKAISQLDELLGLESDDEGGSDDEDNLIKGRMRQPTSRMELDPMEITTDEDGDNEEDDDDLDPMEVTSDEEDEASGSDEFNGFSDAEEGEQSSASDDEDASDAESSASSTSRSPPAKKAATSKRAVKSLRPSDSTFLPTLMGGYVSGSESASDIDVAPERRNRRGQRARQAIWEKKYGEKAKHLHQPAKGRDAGWDLKRGAVEGVSKPWKRGIRNPLLEKSRGSEANATHLGPPPKERAPRTRDDSGPLHPSWEAKRLAKEKLLTAPFQGKKITFD